MNLPAGLIPYFLDRPVWSDFGWQAIIRPYLIARARAGDQAALLERFKTEPRLGDVFLAKDWRDRAMPLLRGFAKERITLDAACLKALAEEREPAMAEDIAALAMRLGPEAADLETLLKTQPGLVWPDFAKAAWTREKYLGKTPVFAWWAAREGDASAFRVLAENAARGDESSLVHIRELVPAGGDDVIGYLRANIGRMEWSRETGKFAVK